MADPFGRFFNNLAKKPIINKTAEKEDEDDDSYGHNPIVGRIVQGVKKVSLDDDDDFDNDDDDDYDDPTAADPVVDYPTTKSSKPTFTMKCDCRKDKGEKCPKCSGAYSEEELRSQYEVENEEDDD